MIVNENAKVSFQKKYLISCWTILLSRRYVSEEREERRGNREWKRKRGRRDGRRERTRKLMMISFIIY